MKSKPWKLFFFTTGPGESSAGETEAEFADVFMLAELSKRPRIITEIHEVVADEEEEEEEEDVETAGFEGGEEEESERFISDITGSDLNHCR